MDVDERQLADDEDAWPTVIEECQEIADEYRDQGWSVVVPVPSDVTAVPAPGDTEDENVGLDVVVSDDEFERLTDLLDTATFDAFNAFRAAKDGVVYLTLVFRATETESAFCLPLYYRVTEADRMLERVRAGDAMTTYCHSLSGDDQLEFRHEDPTPLFPPQDAVKV